MPFKSEKQRRFMHAKHPEIADRWEHKYGPPKGKKRKKRNEPVEGLKRAMDRK